MAGRRNIVLSVIVRTLVCVILLSVAGAVLTMLVRTRPMPAKSAPASQSPRVKVLAARPVPIRRQWLGFGTARAMDSANVPARVTATVIDVPHGILVGTRVEVGELLVSLDDSDFLRQAEITAQLIADIDAQLARLDVEEVSWEQRMRLATEQVELAQAEFERVGAAAQRGSANQREIDVAKQALLTAIRDETGAREELDKVPTRRNGLQARRLAEDARLRLARQSIDRCHITSPITGVVEAVDVELGESLQRGERVARIVDVSRIEIPIKLPSSARSHLRRGDLVRLSTASDSGYPWEADVARIAPADDEMTRTVSVFVEIEQDPDGDPLVAPGQFLRAVVSSSVAQDRWVVPRRSIDGDRLLLVRDGLVVSIGIDVDFQIEHQLPDLGVPDRYWVVLRGALPDGALVVVNPTRSLADGLRVRPVVATESLRAAGRPDDDEAAGDSVETDSPGALP